MAVVGKKKILEMLGKAEGIASNSKNEMQKAFYYGKVLALAEAFPVEAELTEEEKIECLRYSCTKQ